MSLYEARLHVKLLQMDYTFLIPLELSFSDKVRHCVVYLYITSWIYFHMQLDSRITSLMVAGGHLWVGTGKGVVVIFSVSEAVPETKAVIAQLAQNTSEPPVVTVEEGSSSRTGQGLVTAGLTGEGTSQEMAEPSTESTQREDRSGYYQNRRTAFGRTLRGPSARQSKRNTSPSLSPAVFQLHYESSHQLAQAESVRVLLSMW